MKMTPAELARFDSFTALKDTGCREWAGHLDRDGYGTFFFRRRNRRAHRVAYWHIYGDIPKGMLVNHTCRNRACVEVAHLRLATPRENALRESASLPYLNSQKTHCPQGHPYDRHYGRQRYCSICETAKKKRLRAKWAAEDDVAC